WRHATRHAFRQPLHQRGSTSIPPPADWQADPPRSSNGEHAPRARFPPSGTPRFFLDRRRSLPASARQPLFADVRAALNRGVAGLRSALHGLSSKLLEPSQGKLPAMDYPLDRLVIANQLIRGQQITIIF